MTGRQALCSTGTGHVCSSFADSNGAVPTGQYDGLVATADTANATATTWSIVLRTIEPNQAPTASFTQTCDSAACDFDGLARATRTAPSPRTPGTSVTAAPAPAAPPATTS